MYRQVDESQTLLINTKSKELESENKKVIKFGFGQSPFMPPKKVLEALKKFAYRKEYSSVQGNLELRKNISTFHEAHNGLKVLPENILTAPGSKILIFNILIAFKKADILIAAPSWVSYAPQAKLAGHNIIKLKTSFDERWRITPQIIKDATKNKKNEASILILNYPGNPDGLSYTENELKALAKIAKELNILVISDEIYGLLGYNLNHKSFANYYPEKTITTTGLSKWCGAGGWRFGAAFLYDTIEPEFKQALIGIGSETYSCAPVPVQMAATIAYQNYDDTLPYLNKQISLLEQIGNYCAEQLNTVKIHVHSPQGGFYIFPDFSYYKEKLNAICIETSNKLCERLLKDTGVALLPASAFGFDQNYLAARLAFVDFQEPKNEIFNMKADAPNIVYGIHKICTWITDI